MTSRLHWIGVMALATLCVGANPGVQNEAHAANRVPRASSQQLAQAAASRRVLVLNGNDLTPAQVVQIARYGAQVRISDTALERVGQSHEVLMLAAREGQKIYGLTAGVGLNKDQAFVDASGGLSAKVIQLSKTFNRNLLYAHSAGVGPEMAPEVVRAIMTTRLNSILFGATGVQLHVAQLYRDFLNYDIVPVMPSQGSVGQADITLISHIGLAMIGEGDVYYRGQKMPASQALEAAGLDPLDPVGKDALSIFSSNAYSEALAALAIEDLRQLQKVNKLLFALSLEALDGNVEPFLAETHRLRPFPYVSGAAADIRTLLEGSYLWYPSSERALQDPLSFRTGAYTLGAMERSLAELMAQLQIQLNSSDDNPAVIVGGSAPSDRPEESYFYVEEDGLSGAVVPTGNFSPLPWILSLQEVAIALSHGSNASAQRTIKLSDSHFTNLSRFLGTDKTFHAYGAIQKVFADLAAENQSLAQPVSMDAISIAGNIEDLSTNGPRVARRLRAMIDNHYYILAIELMHAAQAIDLRLAKHPETVLAPATQAFFREFREVVTFLAVDRPLTPDIEASYQFLKGYSR